MLEGQWFHEKLFKNVCLSLKIRKKLYDAKSKYQHVQVFDTYQFGRTLVLDDVFQTTEKDEFVYHEMLTHPLLLSLPRMPKKVLIIGGGDAGIAREVLKYPVEKAYLVEIDGMVVKASKKYLKSVCGNSFSDPRLELRVEDGFKFVKDRAQAGEKFDAVIIDSSDPAGPNVPLFSEEFYSDVKSILTPEGITARQTGSSFLQPEEVTYSLKRMKKVFPEASAYVADTPTYMGGLFTFVCGSRKTNPSKAKTAKLREKVNKLKLKTRYYTPEVHAAAFALPAYIQARTRE